jgi:hypothetical protein
MRFFYSQIAKFVTYSGFAAVLYGYNSSILMNLWQSRHENLVLRSCAYRSAYYLNTNDLATCIDLKSGQLPDYLNSCQEFMEQGCLLFSENSEVRFYSARESVGRSKNWVPRLKLND